MIDALEAVAAPEPEADGLADADAEAVMAEMVCTTG